MAPFSRRVGRGVGPRGSRAPDIVMHRRFDYKHNNQNECDCLCLTDSFPVTAMPRGFTLLLSLSSFEYFDVSLLKLDTVLRDLEL